MRLLRLIWLCVALAFAPAAVAAPRAPVVLAAASLQESLTAAADAWARKGNTRPVISFAASSALARQVEAGAPADLFISADTEWMDYLDGKKLLRQGSRASFLGNRLVLIAPASNRVNLEIARGFPLGRALGNGRLALADPTAVPAGKYAKSALTSLGVWPQVESRVAGAENVRAALLMVERRQAPLGIVYATDARASRAVRIVGVFPPRSHPPIRYPIAALRASRNPHAESFRRFLISREGRAIFARYGFTAP